MNRPLHGAAHHARNVIDAGEAVLRNVSIDVEGDDNRIEILPNATLRDVEIKVVGDGHRLRLGCHVWVGSGAFRFYDHWGSILMGERTTIYEAAFGVTEGGTISVGEDCLRRSRAPGVDRRHMAARAGPSPMNLDRSGIGLARERTG